MSDQDSKLNIPLTPEAKAEGQDPYLVSAPSRESVKEGTVEADDDAR